MKLLVTKTCSRIRIDLMIRRIFAGAIVTLLLSVSPLAAACDLSCAFPSIQSDCHLSQIQNSPSDEMKMDGMAMPGMTMPEMADDERQTSVSALPQAILGHPSIGAMGPCEKQACDSPSAISSKTNRPIDSQLHSIVAFFKTPHTSSARSSFHGARDELATRRVPDASPLHLSLRI
jgi:hypothetical protein